MGEIAKNIATESIWKILSATITKAGSLVFVVLLARFLKPEGFGIYNLAMSVILAMTILTDLGINKTLLRYLSDSIGKKKEAQSASYVGYFFKLKIILISFFSICLLILSYPLANFVFRKPDLFLPLLILASFLTIISLNNFLEYFFFAIKKVKFITLREIFFQVIRISLAILVFFLLPEFHYLTAILFAIILSHLLMTLFMVVILKKKAPFLFRKTNENLDKKKIFNFLKYLALAGISATFFAYIDVLMLGAFLPSAYVGYYSAAVALIGSFVALFALSNILLPPLTQMKESQLKWSFEKIFRYVCILTIPTIFGALALGKYLISFLYGAEYFSATIPFYFLSFLIFSGVLTEIFVSLFSAREQPKYFVKPLVISSILNIIFNAILILSLMKISLTWAMTGAAIATIGTRYFYLIFMWIISYKKFQTGFSIKSFLKPLISAGAMFSILILIDVYLISDMTLSKGIGQIFIGVIIYFFIIHFLGGIGKEDYSLIKEIFLGGRSG